MTSALEHKTTLNSLLVLLTILIKPWETPPEATCAPQTIVPAPLPSTDQNGLMKLEQIFTTEQLTPLALIRNIKSFPLHSPHKLLSTTSMTVISQWLRTQLLKNTGRKLMII
jgi:hypothetical protein